jgi:hypothetical protein
MVEVGWVLVRLRLQSEPARMPALPVLVMLVVARD